MAFDNTAYNNGWIGAIAIFPLLKSLHFAGMAWLLAGGVLYTIGAAIYFIESRVNKAWPHEIFHILTLAGSASHYWLLLKYV